MHSKTIRMFDHMESDDVKYMISCLAEYAETKEVDWGKIDSLSPIVAVAMEDAIERMDADMENYERLSKVRSDAGRKGAEKRWQSHNLPIAKMANDSKDMANDSRDIANDDASVSVSVLKEKDIPTVYPKRKEQKHQYGEYKHVLLTDAEHDRLCADYGIDTTSEAIKFLDAYIEEKGYKSKSHNLALRRWVFDALKDKPKKNKWSAKVDNRNYEMDDLERQLYAAQGV